MGLVFSEVQGREGLKGLGEACGVFGLCFVVFLRGHVLGSLSSLGPPLPYAGRALLRHPPGKMGNLIHRRI